jgi:hypothetical protein
MSDEDDLDLVETPVKRVAEVTRGISELCSEGEELYLAVKKHNVSIKLGLLAVAADAGYVTLTPHGLRVIGEQVTIFEELGEECGL